MKEGLAAFAFGGGKDLRVKSSEKDWATYVLCDVGIVVVAEGDSGARILREFSVRGDVTAPNLDPALALSDVEHVLGGELAFCCSDKPAICCGHVTKAVDGDG